MMNALKYMKNVIMYKKGEQSWIRWIKKRIKNNLNFLAIAEGPTGIGKSWGMIRVAYDLDNDFEARQIAFSFKQVMEIINADWFKKKKLKVIVFDEAQTDISNRQWQSLTNKLFNYLLSTFRHQNIILLFTSPYSDFIDSQSMKLIHCRFDIKGHNRETKQTHIRPKLLQYNSKLKKFYEHSLFVIRDSKYIKLVDWHVTKPPQHLIEPYEQAKCEFTSKLNKSILEQLNSIEEKSKPKPKKPLTELQEKIWDLWNTGLNQKQIAEKLGKVPQHISDNVKFMRNKGYSLVKQRKIPNE